MHPMQLDKFRDFERDAEKQKRLVAFKVVASKRAHEDKLVKIRWAKKRSTRFL